MMAFTPIESTRWQTKMGSPCTGLAHDYNNMHRFIEIFETQDDNASK